MISDPWAVIQDVALSGLSNPSEVTVLMCEKDKNLSQNSCGNKMRQSCSFIHSTNIYEVQTVCRELN